MEEKQARLAAVHANITAKLAALPEAALGAASGTEDKKAAWRAHKDAQREPRACNKRSRKLCARVKEVEREAQRAETRAARQAGRAARKEARRGAGAEGGAAAADAATTPALAHSASEGKLVSE